MERRAIKVRAAAESDIPRFAELLLQVEKVHYDGRPDLFRPDARKYSNEDMIKILHDDSKPVFAAADENGEVLGYAFCADVTPVDDNILAPVRTLYIDDICVDEKCRGTGVGKALYSYVREWAKEQGYTRITLNVWSCNPSAMQFYIAMGLVPYKICMETLL